LQLNGKHPYDMYDAALHITVTYPLSDTSRSDKIALTA